MKKILFTALLILVIIATFAGCNKQLFDTTYKFDKAIISLPNGETIEGKIDSWKDYEDGDQIQVVINGNTYLVHSSNIVMINEK